jgi:hypothetical protein
MSDRRSRYLVAHDYGMGALWWWVWARSAQEIVETCAEVEVVTNPEMVSRADGWDLQVVDLDGDGLGPLESHRTERNAQRDRPGFGALVGHEMVHLRYEDPDAEAAYDEVYLLELGPDGRRLRQVVIDPDGSATAEGPDDWPFNPPFDLYDPKLAVMQITSDEFEAAWSKAQTVDGATL